MLVLNGAIAAIRELHAWLLRILLTMMLLLRVAQLKIMLMLILIFTLHLDYLKNLTMSRDSFMSLDQADSTSIWRPKLRNQ